MAPQPPGVQVPGPAGQPGGGAERAPLIIPERRSNSLIVHAKKHEVETIRRLVAQLDVNIYGGRRVFIYYAENAKSKDLAATLNAIYGARDGSSGGGHRRRGALDARPRPRRPRRARRHRLAAHGRRTRPRCWPRARCASSPTRSPTR